MMDVILAMVEIHYRVGFILGDQPTEQISTWTIGQVETIRSHLPGITTWLVFLEKRGFSINYKTDGCPV